MLSARRPHASVDDTANGLLAEGMKVQADWQRPQLVKGRSTQIQQRSNISVTTTTITITAIEGWSAVATMNVVHIAAAAAAALRQVEMAAKSEIIVLREPRHKPRVLKHAPQRWKNSCCGVLSPLLLLHAA